MRGGSNWLPFLGIAIVLLLAFYGVEYLVKYIARQINHRRSRKLADEGFAEPGEYF